MRLLIASLVAALYAALPAFGHSNKRPSYVEPWAWNVAVCETGGNPRHHAGAFEGAWGWFHSTYMLDRVAGAPAHAYKASMREQYRTFLRSAARGRHFGCLAGS